MDRRNSKYLKYAETKTPEFARRVEQAVREFDPFAEDDEIEKSKATLTGLKKHLDSEMQNRDLSFRIEKSDHHADDIKQKFTSVLKVNFAKVESTPKNGEEFGTTVQEEFE